MSRHAKGDTNGAAFMEYGVDRGEVAQYIVLGDESQGI
jgi:hypothetical protein